MQTNYILIDYENVRVTSLALLTGEHFQVWVFLGPNNTRLEVPFVLAIQEFRERAVLITMKARGANALDFHIAYYLGLLAKGDPTGFFHIISKDTGFDPLIEHLKTRGATWLDCQVITPHMEVLGAREIARARFLDLLAEAQAQKRELRCVRRAVKHALAGEYAAGIDTVQTANQFVAVPRFDAVCVAGAMKRDVRVDDVGADPRAVLTRTRRFRT